MMLKNNEYFNYFDEKAKKYANLNSMKPYNTVLPYLRKGLGYAVDYRFLIPALSTYGYFYGHDEMEDYANKNRNSFNLENTYDATDDLYDIYKEKLQRGEY